MNQDYRKLTLHDVPVGLVCPQNIHDYWGRVILKKGQTIHSYQEQSFVTKFPFFVLINPNTQTTSAPFHQIPLSDFTFEQQISLIHDRLTQLIHQKEPPAQLQNLIIMFAQRLQHLYNEDCVQTIQIFLDKSSPSNAVLNSMHCAILCEGAGIICSLSDAHRQSLACAALTMNWNIIDLQNELSGTPHQPTVQQRNTILSHPMKSYKMLQALGVEDEIWLKAVLHHHEEPDGRGYPQQLTFSQISTPSHLLRLVDRFVALVSSRSTRNGIPANQAIKQLVNQTSAFPPEVLSSLNFIVKDFYPSEDKK